MHSLMYGYVGRWDLAKEAAEQSIIKEQSRMEAILVRSGEEYDPSMEEAAYSVMGVDYSMSSFLDRLAQCQMELGEIDEAISTLRDRVVPQYIREVGEDDMDVANTFVKAAYLSQERGQYGQTLEMLEEAQAVLLRSGGPKDDREARRREMTQNQEAIARVQELMQIAMDQEDFVQAYVDMASRWNFASGQTIASDGPLESESTSTSNVCPNVAMLKRRHRPSPVIVLSFFGSLFWKIIRFVRTKPSRFRGALALILAALVSVWVGMYWNWERADGLTDRLNFEADVRKMAGQDEKALLKYDAARCSILADPHEEALLVHPDIVLETFMGPAYIYGARGQLEALEMLVMDIADLLAKDSGQLEPSFDLYNFYLFLSSEFETIDEIKSKHYSNLAEKEGRAYARLVTAEVEEHIQQLLERGSKPLNETEKLLKEAEEQEEEDSGPEISVGYI